MPAHGGFLEPGTGPRRTDKLTLSIDRPGTFHEPELLLPKKASHYGPKFMVGHFKMEYCRQVLGPAQRGFRPILTSHQVAN